MGGTLYALAGGKGGVGKTTTTLNLATALQTTGTDTAVVDADLGMANLGELAGVDADVGIHDVLAGQATVEEAVATGPEGLTVLAGDRELDAFRRADPATLGDVTEKLCREHDVVLVDTGAGLSHESLVSFGLADGVLLVTTTDRAAAVDTGKTADVVREVDGSVLGAVVNRTASDPHVGDVVDAVGEPLLGKIPDAPDLAGSEPMVETAPESDPAVAFRRLAGSVAAHAGVDRQAAASASTALEAPAGPTQD